jgi:tight adherence protein C
VSGLAPIFAALAVALVASGVASAARPPVVVVEPVGEGSDVSDGSAAPGRAAERRFRRRRAPSVDRQVPQLLDLVAAGSSAGLSAELALRRAADVLDGRLGDDLRALFGRADLGARWRDGFAVYAEASGSRDLRRTVTALERTERLGSSLAEASDDLATAVRTARRADMLERARTAPVKMLFPLVLLILPAFLLLTVVPVLLATVRTIA